MPAPRGARTATARGAAVHHRGTAMLMLTDTDPALDLRVIHARRALGEPALLVAEAASATPFRVLSAFLTLLLGIAVGTTLHGERAERIARPMHARLGTRIAGLRSFARSQARSLQFVWRERAALRRAGHLHAHDQVCGLTAWFAQRFWGVSFDYDAHEIVPFRPRRTGRCRMLLEFAWERAIVRSARRCIVVNQPMRRIYRHLYGPANYVVQPNDFFVDREVALSPSGQRLLVYVGSTGAHRQLDAMLGVARRDDAEVTLYVPDAATVAAALGVPRCHELAGYETALIDEIAGQAPYFWCAFDAAIPSYRHSLPNKFFQAMALGAPIVATQGTYLARLVRRHGLGAVIDDAHVQGESLWAPVRYEAARDAMRRFRAAYRRGDVVI